MTSRPFGFDGDWDFCRDHLQKLSRTFAVPIAMLADDLEIAVTCGYLLCRIIDSVEDHPSLALGDRDELYGKFLDVVEGGAEPEVFEEAFGRLAPDRGDETVLCQGLGRVLGVLAVTPAPMGDVCLRWVCEMARGMQIFSHRTPGPDGVLALTSIADLERYCYFVAGTVGQMLTELFVEAAPDVTSDRELIMRTNAERFGAGLQLVNIIKDMSEDLERGVSFMPRILWSAQGLQPREIVTDGGRPAAHRAVAPVLTLARGYLDDAFDYTLAIPPDQREIRLFCLVPLWLAVATLHRADGNDDLFVTGRKVKITRDEVGTLVNQCVELAEDDDGLRAAYRALTKADQNTGNAGAPHPATL